MIRGAFKHLRQKIVGLFGPLTLSKNVKSLSTLLRHHLISYQGAKVKPVLGEGFKSTF